MTDTVSYAILFEIGSQEGISGAERESKMANKNQPSTEKKQPQNSEKHRKLLENANMPMVYYATDGRFLFMNEFATRNLRHTNSSFLGTSLYDLLPSLADELRIRNRMLTERGIGQQYEDAIELSSGTRWFSSMAQPLIDDNGKVFAIQVISQDITKFKNRKNVINYCNDRLSLNIPSSDAWDLLTAREKEIFEFTAIGYNRVEIADQLCISPRTAEAHRSNAMSKLGLRNKTDLIRFALRKGIISL